MVNMRIHSGMMAKAIEAFIWTVGGDMNCRVTGRVVRGRLIFRVAKRFLPYARHFSYKNLDWDIKIIKRFELFSSGNLRGSRQDGRRRHDTENVAAILNGACGSFRYRSVYDHSPSYANIAASILSCHVYDFQSKGQSTFLYYKTIKFSLGHRTTFWFIDVLKKSR